MKEEVTHHGGDGVDNHDLKKEKVTYKTDKGEKDEEKDDDIEILIHIQEDKAIVAGDVTTDNSQRRCQKCLHP